MKKLYAVFRVEEYEGSYLVSLFYGKDEAEKLCDILNTKEGEESGVKYVREGIPIKTTAEQHVAHKRKRNFVNKLNWLRKADKNVKNKPEYLQNLINEHKHLF